MAVATVTSGRLTAERLAAGRSSNSYLWEVGCWVAAGRNSNSYLYLGGWLLRGWCGCSNSYLWEGRLTAERLAAGRRSNSYLWEVGC